MEHLGKGSGYGTSEREFRHEAIREILHVNNLESWFLYEKSSANRGRLRYAVSWHWVVAIYYTPPQFKGIMGPENDAFQKESPLPGVHFQVNHVKFGECKSWPSKETQTKYQEELNFSSNSKRGVVGI